MLVQKDNFQLGRRPDLLDAGDWLLVADLAGGDGAGIFHAFDGEAFHLHGSQVFGAKLFSSVDTRRNSSLRPTRKIARVSLIRLRCGQRDVANGRCLCSSIQVDKDALHRIYDGDVLKSRFSRIHHG